MKAEKKFRKWLKAKKGIQIASNYEGTECEEIVIEYASEQLAIKDKQIRDAEGMFEEVDLTAFNLSNKLKETKKQLAELEEKILNIENDLHWAEAKLAKHKELIEPMKRLMRAIITLYPNMAMDEPKQEECYMAYHELRKRISELEKEIQ